MFINIIIAVVILAALILIHEIGHFVAARFFGMRVNEFGIGFPPRLWGRKKGDTVYSINASVVSRRLRTNTCREPRMKLGISRGKTIRKKADHNPAPLVAAASSSSR